MSSADDRLTRNIHPKWLKIKLQSGKEYKAVKQIVEENHLHTICESGQCPNRMECWERRTATLMILGDICTRSCRFCATATGRPLPVDPDQPRRVAQSIKMMGLRYAVITSVDRDDLTDGGARMWAETVTAIKAINPTTQIEVLIPDFGGDPELVDIVLAAGAEVVGHNLETVERLTPQVRSAADYRCSLNILSHIAATGVLTKSGLMVGLGETEEEVLDALRDLRKAGVEIVTIGQYLQPTRAHLPVAEYISPEKFEFYGEQARTMGFRLVASAPLVRSSYLADRATELPDVQRLRFRNLGLVPYQEAWDLQRKLFNEKVEAKSLKSRALTQNHIIFCEHPPVFTMGKSGKSENLLVDPDFLGGTGAELYRIERGGDITFHGPGQLVCYPILDLELVGMGLREYIRSLEEAVIRTLARWGIVGERVDGASGVWVVKEKQEKICAIGVRSSRFVTMHGLALNVNTDLKWFDYINPCGFTDRGVTSMARELESQVDMAEVRQTLQRELEMIIRTKTNIKTEDNAYRKTLGCQTVGGPSTRAGTRCRSGDSTGIGKPPCTERHNNPQRS